MKNLFYLSFIFLVLFTGCDKNEESATLQEINALEASNVTSYGFQMNWQAIENADSYDIEIATDIDFISIIRNIHLNGSDHNLCIVTGLNENINYYYRLQYYIGEKISGYSNIITVITYKTITALEATDITPTGFQANWNTIDGVDTYEIEIAEDEEFNNVVKTNQINDYQIDSLKVTNLEKDVKYYYRVRYVEGTTTSHHSNTISVTTNHVEFTSITALEASNVTIYGFQANWEKVEKAESYDVEVSLNSDFSGSVKEVQVSADQDSLVIDDLEKNKTYYYRVKYNVWDKTSGYSNVISIVTNLINSDFTLTTNGILTKANISYKLDYTNPVPAVIFIHMGGANRFEWTNNVLYQMCIDSGYVALAYDLRGHGESEGTIDWNTFTTDPDILPKDLDDVISYLQNLDFVNPDRIGIVGGSMGAILATGASQYSYVKVVVALTSFYDPVEDLYGISNINTVYYIAGEYDNADESQALFDITREPRKLDIIEGSSNHSAALLYNEELRKNVFSWIKEYL